MSTHTHTHTHTHSHTHAHTITSTHTQGHEMTTVQSSLYPPLRVDSRLPLLIYMYVHVFTYIPQGYEVTRSSRPCTAPLRVGFSAAITYIHVRIYIHISTTGVRSDDGPIVLVRLRCGWILGCHYLYMCMYIYTHIFTTGVRSDDSPVVLVRLRCGWILGCCYYAS